MLPQNDVSERELAVIVAAACRVVQQVLKQLIAGAEVGLAYLRTLRISMPSVGDQTTRKAIPRWKRHLNSSLGLGY